MSELGEEEEQSNLPGPHHSNGLKRKRDDMTELAVSSDGAVPGQDELSSASDEEPIEVGEEEIELLLDYLSRKMNALAQSNEL